MRRLGLFLLLLTLICAAGGYALFLRGERQFREAVAETLNWVASGAVRRLDVPTPWRQAVPADVASLSRAVAAGNFPLFPAIRLMRSFEQGPVFLTLVLRGFEGRVRPRYVDEVHRKEFSRRLARFFAAWKKLGQPIDVLASATLRLTIEKEELTRTPSGFATPEIFRFLRQNWEEERAESALAFFDALSAKTGSGAAFLPANENEESEMPEPLDELRAEIARLVALGTGKNP